MQKVNLKFMVMILCILFSGLIFPTNTLALSIPSAPTELRAEPESSSEVFLRWNSVSNATSYNIYRATTSSGTYSKIASTTSTNYINTNLSEDTTYYYAVVAVNSSGTSDYSSKAYATTTEFYSLSAPTDLRAEAESSSEIYLRWDSVDDAKSYYVYRSTSSSGTYSKVATTTSTRYTDTDLVEDKTYYYKVKAVEGSGTSDYSSKVYATTLESDQSEDLSTPTDLRVEAESSSEIYLRWDSVDDAESYYVYRSTSSSGTYSKIATTTSTRYTNTGLSADTTYYYKVQAVDSSGTSAYSSKEYATTTEFEQSEDLSAPTDLRVEAESSSEIYLRWDSVHDAESYYVYRSTSSSGTYSKIATTTSTRYTNTGLSADTTYYYKVQAVDSYGTSAYSSKESATTDESDELSVPKDLTAEAVSANAIYLRWDSVDDATSYDVYRSTSSSGTYSKAATTTSASYTNTGLSSDTTYYYKVMAVNSYATSTYSDKVYASTDKSNNPAPSDPSKIEFERLAGNDMYETSAEVSKAGWQTSYYAIIVSGENYTDALCSAPLAQKYNAPILLTLKDKLNEQTKSELARLKVKNVIIIGGVGIISSGVEQSINNMDIEVSRIAGNDRYDTSIKIAQSMGQFNEAVVASGDTFPDAMSIAPIAAMKGMPILLTTRDVLPENVKNYLLKNVQSTYVVGGTGVVSENVFKQLPSPKRLSGFSRYDTNISILKEFADELDFSTCYISTGELFADALGGSALASITNSPIILVSDPVDLSTLDFFKDKHSSINKEVVFGGTFVVPESVLISINASYDGSESDIPSTPTNLTATTAGDSQINLSWDSVSGATSYYVYGATSSSGTFTHLATVTTTGYINIGLWADTTYYYKVKAVNSAGSSSYSTTDYAKTTLSD